MRKISYTAARKPHVRRCGAARDVSAQTNPYRDWF